MARERTRPEINITPLVDVVLVLLIIFMVVAPQMEAGVEVKLPGAANADAEAASLEAITVTLTRDGRFFLEKEALSEATLVSRLTELHATAPARRVVLKADEGLPYGAVRALFRRCRQIGFPGAALQVLERGPQRG